MPDVVVYPTGGGTGIVGMWKAFDEMEQLGWIGSHRPRLISVQANGCAPIARAFQQGTSTAEPWQHASTIAAGLRVPSPIGDYLILRALRDSRGTAVTVSDEEMTAAMVETSRTEGIFPSTEAAATVAGLSKLIKTGDVDPTAEIVLFLTGTGLLNPVAVTTGHPSLDPDDSAAFAAAFEPGLAAT